MCTFIIIFGVSLLETYASLIPCDFLGILSLSVFYAVLWPLVILIACCLMCCMANVIEIILQSDSGTHIHTQPLKSSTTCNIPMVFFQTPPLSWTGKSYVCVCVCVCVCV